MRDLRPNRFLDMFAPGPAPKEEEMEPAVPHRRCKCCPCYLMQHEHEVCDTCLKARRQCVADSTAERRALYRDAYMAALGGYCANPVRHHCGGEAYEIDPDIEAHKAALETVRQWDAMIAELEEG